MHTHAHTHSVSTTITNGTVSTVPENVPVLPVGFSEEIDVFSILLFDQNSFEGKHFMT